VSLVQNGCPCASMILVDSVLSGVHLFAWFGQNVLQNVTVTDNYITTNLGWNHGH
jgi:hypothetical protein